MVLGQDQEESSPFHRSTGSVALALLFVALTCAAILALFLARTPFALLLLWSLLGLSIYFFLMGLLLIHRGVRRFRQHWSWLTTLLVSLWFQLAALLFFLFLGLLSESDLSTVVLRVLHDSSDEWHIMLSAAFGAALYLQFYFYAKRRYWQIRAAGRSSLASLQARIRPHFLFNTLNTISSLIHDHPDQAEQATLDMADLLRTSLKGESTHALSDELDLIHGYLRIEQLRLGDRLKIQWELADEVPLDQQLPPLLFQPLVENAIIHGISRRAEGGMLRIEGKRIRFGRLRFTVTNPLADPDSRPAEGNHSALENIRQRLALAYEERYGLKTWIEDGHFIAELTIPVT